MNKNRWKGFVGSLFKACPGPTADGLGELPPHTFQEAPQLPAAWLLAASAGTDTDGVELAAAGAGSLPSPKLQ